MIAITGANGFIGKEFVKCLHKNKEKVCCLVLEGEDVTELKSYGAKVIYGDILNKEMLMRFVSGARQVVHLAAIVTSNDSELLYKVNVDGTRNIVEACKKNKVKHIIFTSSIAAVAKHPGPYGRSKTEAEKIVKGSGLKYTILRPTLVYGKNGPEFNELVKTIKKLPVIPIIGKGLAKKNLVYVEDLAEVMVRVLYSKKPLNKTYEIGGSEKISFAELVETICENLSIKRVKIRVPLSLCLVASDILKIILKKPPLTKDQLLALENDAVADICSLKKDFSFKPMPLQKGLKLSLVK